MPNLKEKWYPRKEPILQMSILNHIALKGRLVQQEGPVLFGCKPSTISEALNIMRTKRGLIEVDRKNPPDFKKGERQKKLYKLTSKGLIEFINGNPSPYEFWIALIWYCTLNSAAINRRQLNEYYYLFIRKFVGDSYSLRSCFFLSDSFDNLFKKWRRTYDSAECNTTGTVGYFKHPETLQAYKVFECLLQNRSITIQKIIELTKLNEQQVIKTLYDYSLTQNRFYHYTELFEGVYQSDRMIGLTTDYLSHLVIIPISEKASGVGKYDNNDEKYELSVLGVMLVLASTSLTQRKTGLIISSSTQKCYKDAALNYQDKLPLIFGKWKLLKEVLKLDFFPSIFDYLFLDKLEILSLSVSLGGNKEIYDNIKSTAISTANKFFMLYDACTLAIWSNEYPKEFLKNKHYQFIQEKLNEIEMSLKYGDLESFAKHMISKRPKPPLPHVSLTFKDMPVWKVNELFVHEQDYDFIDDLHFIESTLADEFSFLFYIGLLRDNNHKASDYPLTTGFIRPSPNLVYPKRLLMKILKGDKEIRNKFMEWMKEALSYQKQTLKKMDDISTEINTLSRVRR